MTPPSPSPRHTSGHGAFEELAVGYALHALEPEDELRFTAHLAGCPPCARAVSEHAETLAALGSSGPQEEPPPSVLAGIRAAIGTPPLPAQAPVEVPVVRDELAARRREVAVRRSWLLSAAAGVVALVLGLGGWAVVLQDQRDDQSARADRLAAAVAQLERPDARTVRLATSDGAVQLVVVAQGEEASLVVDGLEPNPADTVYVLWGQDADGAVAALAAFDVPDDGLEVLDAQSLRVPVSRLTTLMVTHEKGRDLPAQTVQPVVLVGKV